MFSNYNITKKKIVTISQLNTNDHDSGKKIVTYMIYVLIEKWNNRNTKNLNGEL